MMRKPVPQAAPKVEHLSFYNYLIGYAIMFHPDGRVSLYVEQEHSVREVTMHDVAS